MLGPDAAGAKVRLPRALEGIAGLAQSAVRRLPAVPALVPDLPVQLIHQHDVATALLQCVVGAGPAGAYNIAADDVLSLVDVAREAGLRPVPVPGAPVAAAARAASKLPLPPTAQWVEALSHPAIMDTTKARIDLGWTPQYSAMDALRATFGQDSEGPRA